MTTQQQNAAMAQLLSVYFVGRNEPNYALGQAISSILAFPALRAFWPMSSVDYTAASRARDIAGSGYHLTDHNAVLFGSGQMDASPNLVPYAEFDGVNQYLSRADGGAANWADITGTEAYVPVAEHGLTLGCWVYHDILAPATQYAIMSKWAAAGGVLGTLSYLIDYGNAPRFIIADQANAAQIATSTKTIAISEWIFHVGRFIPSTTVDVFIGDSSGIQKDSTATVTSTSIIDSTTVFAIGSKGVASNYLNGRTSLNFLCAAALSDSAIIALYNNTRKLYNV